MHLIWVPVVVGREVKGGDGFGDPDPGVGGAIPATMTRQPWYAHKKVSHRKLTLYTKLFPNDVIQRTSNPKCMCNAAQLMIYKHLQKCLITFFTTVQFFFKPSLVISALQIQADMILCYSLRIAQAKGLWVSIYCLSKGAPLTT